MSARIIQSDEPATNGRINLGYRPEIAPLRQMPPTISKIGPAFKAMKDDEFKLMLVELFRRNPNWIGRPIPRPDDMGPVPDTMTVAEAGIAEGLFVDAHPQDVARRMMRLAAKGQPLELWAEHFSTLVPFNEHYWGMPPSEL